METNLVLFDFLELFIDILKIDLFDILCICSVPTFNVYNEKCWVMKEGKVNVDYAKRF